MFKTYAAGCIGTEGAIWEQVEISKGLKPKPQNPIPNSLKAGQHALNPKAIGTSLT